MQRHKKTFHLLTYLLTKALNNKKVYTQSHHTVSQKTQTLTINMT